jgi:hypothetical protein
MACIRGSVLVGRRRTQGGPVADSRGLRASPYRIVGNCRTPDKPLEEVQATRDEIESARPRLMEDLLPGTEIFA